MRKRKKLVSLLLIATASCAKYDAPGSYLLLLLSGSATASSTSSSVPKIFVTASLFDGNFGGVAGADAKCMIDSNYPGTGTFKALMVDGVSRTACTASNCPTGTIEHTNLVFAANTAYVRRSDLVAIFTTDTSGIFTFGNLTNAFGTSANYHWTGLRTDWTNSGSDCTNWTTASTGVNGRVGLDNATDVSSIRDNTPPVTCDLLRTLVCVQQ